ncbi:hypothetical protein ACE939_12565 [Aquimarina sp. W85]|uniref:DUF6973 domain-containing protein n=1 Tax=Aquimarina rhodophyticola TaxID=3342246 RepID=UPI00366BD9DA
MTAWELISGFNLRQMLRLSCLMIRYPLYIFPTLKATQETLKICNQRYGTLHHKSGKANAFRHAIWNILLCRKAYRHSKSIEKAVDWAKRITDLHEQIAPNNSLDMAMDLHNNAIGRLVFEQYFDSAKEELITITDTMAHQARYVSNIENIANFEKELVYIAS